MAGQDDRRDLARTPASAAGAHTLASRGADDLVALLGDETPPEADLFTRLRDEPLAVDPVELADAARRDAQHAVALQRQLIAGGDPEKTTKLRELTKKWWWAEQERIWFRMGGFDKNLATLIEIYAQSLIGENSDEQIAAYRKAIELGMTRPNTFLLLGDVHHNRHEWKESVSCYARCFLELKKQGLGPETLQGGYAELHITMAYCLDEIGDYYGALMLQARGIQLGSTDFQSWDDFGVYFQRVNRRDIRDKFRRHARPGSPISPLVNDMLTAVICGFGTKELVELIGYVVPPRTGWERLFA